VGVIVELKGG